MTKGRWLVDLVSGNKSCTDVVSESVLRDISLHPAGFYVDVHSARYPDGAGPDHGRRLPTLPDEVADGRALSGRGRYGGWLATDKGIP